MKKLTYISLYIILLTACSDFGSKAPHDNPYDSDDHYNPLTFTVTFYTQEGSSVPSQTINYGEKISEPVPPTRTGYIFAGWYKEDTCNNTWDFNSDIVTSNRVLYAKWIINYYQVPIMVTEAHRAMSPQTRQIMVMEKPLQY